MARVMSMPMPIPQATMHNTSYVHIESPSTSLAQRRQLRDMQVDVPSSSSRSTELWSDTQSAYSAYASASNYVQTPPQTPRLGRASSTPPPAPCKSRRRNRVEMQHGDEIQGPSRRLRF